jgi:predicted nucleic acid-binding protein
MTSILDTSVVIGPFPLGLDDEVGVSIVTFAQLHRGVMVAADQHRRAERLRRLSLLQSQFDPLPIDGPVAAAYGRLAAEVVGGVRPSRARQMDLLIAATALAHGARLVTRAAPDYAGLEDLVEIVSL